MNLISISKLKTNPAKAISEATEFPVAVAKRNKVQAYLVGKELYEKLVKYLENYVDSKTVESTDFTKGKDFDKVAKELGI